MAVNSDIGKLKKVIVHRPGQELEYLAPLYLEELLFDEIPWLERAQEEHDLFVKEMHKNGTQVIYITDLIKDVLMDETVKRSFIEEQLKLSHIGNQLTKEKVIEHLMEQNPEYVAKNLIRGFKRGFVKELKEPDSLADIIESPFPFYLSPLPSMYFTRDQGITMGDKILISSMNNDSRRRETLYTKYAVNHHPLFSNIEPLMEDRLPAGLEGGDLIVASEDLLIIGLSERTTEQAIEALSKELLIDNPRFKEILVIQIPSKRAYMHLDTVFNMIDYDKFVMYPGIKDNTYTYRLTAGKDGQVKAVKAGDLNEALSTSLKRPVNIIYSGGNDPITAAREQWSDSTNTLALAPGKVLAYNRNTVTNAKLRREGIEVVEFEGSELVRGRGGSRCMSMPIEREPLK
ncbi:arginine deiminase [Proteinivorax hydrogeniformans]|uniref:arginine deiminase n=1 Tax=Proteinivorax hydrogeniformans TaxID=1826727 RepID=A0AAU8HU64_9FIRM